MQHGPKPEELLRMVPLAAVDDSVINAVIASLAGYFLAYARRPPPPGIPTVRAFQAAQGQIALEWLRERTGWRKLRDAGRRWSRFGLFDDVEPGCLADPVLHVGSARSAAESDSTGPTSA